MKYVRFLQNLFTRKSKKNVKLGKGMSYDVIYYNNVIDLGFNILKEFTEIIPLYLKDFDLSKSFTDFLNETYAENGRVHENQKIDDIVKILDSTLVKNLSNVIVDIRVSEIEELSDIMCEFNTTNTLYELLGYIDGFYCVRIKLSLEDIVAIVSNHNKLGEYSCLILRSILEGLFDQSYIFEDSDNYELLELEDCVGMTCNEAITKQSIFIKEELSNGDILVGVDTFTENISMNNVYILTKKPLGKRLYTNSVIPVDDVYYLSVIPMKTVDFYATIYSDNLSTEVYNKAIEILLNYKSILKDEVLSDDYSGIDEILD